MLELGLGRYNAPVESARKHSQMGRTKAGQRLLRELLPEFTRAIKEITVGKRQRRIDGLSILLTTMLTRQLLYLQNCSRYISSKHSMTSMTCGWQGKKMNLRCVHLVRTNEKGEGIIKGASETKASQFRHIQLSMRHEEEKRHPDFELGQGAIELLVVLCWLNYFEQPLDLSSTITFEKKEESGILDLLFHRHRHLSGSRTSIIVGRYGPLLDACC